MNDEPSTSRNRAPCCICGRCQKQWEVWYDFLVDPEVRLLGLQLVQGTPGENLLVFDHTCGTSISVSSSRLHPLVPSENAHSGDDDLSSRISGEECNRVCLDLESLIACDRPCPWGRDRLLAQSIIDLRRELE